MPDNPKLTFSHKEVVTALLKYQDIHEGIWGLYVEFGIGALNFGPNPDEILPTAFVPVKKIGLQQFPSINNLSVDASIVNPVLKRSKPTKSAKNIQE